MTFYRRPHRGHTSQALLLTGALTGAPPHRHSHRRSSSQALSPDELPAVEAEGGLAEEGGHELVSVDLVDAPPDRALPLPGELLKGLLHRLLCSPDTQKHTKNTPQG